MIRTYTLTLNNTVQRLSDVLPQEWRPHPITGRAAPLEPALYELRIQAGGANAVPVYLGGANDPVSASNYGVRIEISAAGVPPGPTVFQALYAHDNKLSDFGVFGASGTLTLFVIFRQ